MCQQSQSIVAMEVCGSANYWARQFAQLGHQVKLIAPQFVKPFVKGNKNDKQDARAIAEAAQRPQMRFVPPKTIEQQDIQSLLRIRESYVEMRTKTGNQVRGLLAEYGFIVAQGLSQLREELPGLFDRSAENGLTPQMKALLERQYQMLLILDERIGECDVDISNRATEDERCQRLQEIPGIGKISALALIAHVGNGAEFNNGRHFSAYLGLVPRQHSSGQKQLLQGITKRGDAHIRRLLVHGARSVLIRVGEKTDSRSCWIRRLKEKCGHNKAAVALANKNARIAMALLKSEEPYRKAA